MNSADIQADGVELFILNQRIKGRQHVLLAALDQQALSMFPPEHVVVFERRHQFFGRRVFQREPVDLSASRVFAVVENAVNAAVLLVAEVRFVSSPLPCSETGRCRVVLHDKAVPIDDPDVAVGPDFGHDGSSPLVVACQQVEEIIRTEIASFTAEHEGSHQMSGRLIHEGRAVPVFLRIMSSGV